MQNKNQLSILITRREKSVSNYFFLAFCSLKNRLMYKIFIEQMLFYERSVHKKNKTQLEAVKIAFFPKPDIRTNGHE